MSVTLRRHRVHSSFRGDTRNTLIPVLFGFGFRSGRRLLFRLVVRLVFNRFRIILMQSFMQILGEELSRIKIMKNPGDSRLAHPFGTCTIVDGGTKRVHGCGGNMGLVDEQRVIHAVRIHTVSASIERVENLLLRVIVNAPVGEHADRLHVIPILEHVLHGLIIIEPVMITTDDEWGCGRQIHATRTRFPIVLAAVRASGGFTRLVC